MSVSRRQFLAAAGAAAALTPYHFTANAEDRAKPKSKNDRYRIGSIGMKYQGSVIAKLALPYADVVAIADVDRKIGEKAVADFGGKADLYEDYRKILDRKDIDAVTIGTPDHWHVKMAIDACRAGKDVYCEKPLTLTVDEGKQLVAAVKENGRVLQTGSWQRDDCRFRLGVEMVRAGAIGKPPQRDRHDQQEQAGRPVQNGNSAGMVQLGPLARPNARRPVYQGAIPLHVPLVVRILRRPDDRLGLPPHGHRPMGNRRRP